MHSRQIRYGNQALKSDMLVLSLHSTRLDPQPRLKESPSARFLQGERGFSIWQWLREGNILELDSTCMHISTASHIQVRVYQACHTLRLDAAMGPHQTQVTPDVLCTLSCAPFHHHTFNPTIKVSKESQMLSTKKSSPSAKRMCHSPLGRGQLP